jgi:hypothetical protein
MVAQTKAEATEAITRSSSNEFIPLFIEEPKKEGPPKQSIKVPGVEKTIKKTRPAQSARCGVWRDRKITPCWP